MCVAPLKVLQPYPLHEIALEGQVISRRELRRESTGIEGHTLLHHIAAVKQYCTCLCTTSLLWVLQREGFPIRFADPDSLSGDGRRDGSQCWPLARADGSAPVTRVWKQSHTISYGTTDPQRALPALRKSRWTPVCRPWTFMKSRTARQ